MAQLKIFSASAGSGKTYTLARQVIDLLVADPRSYAHVLAVTFTNKATGEMKERIVGDLDLMAYGDDSDSAREALLSTHVAMCRDRGAESASRTKVVERCKVALTNILLDYGQFSICTIDSFVQRVIRSFAYEQGLPSNYGLQLDTAPVIESAVGDLMESLSSDVRLRNLVIAMTEEAIDSDKAWGGAEKQICDIGEAFLNEGAGVDPDTFSAQNITLLRDNMARRRAEALRSVLKLVADIRVKYAEFNISQLNARSKRFMDLISCVLPDAEHTAADIRKTAHFAENVIETLLELNIDKLRTNKSTGDVEAFLTYIRQCVEEAECLRRELNTAHCVLSNTNVLGVMGSLAKFIADVEARNNKMNMTGSGKLLSDLIDGCPIPFVYEKIGVRYDTIMIDEFQDTSSTQYENFRPLLSESLSEGHDCLLVGDVKQSIYRFRGGDWQLLGMKVGNDFASQAKSLPLSDNYRSKRPIVAFNNALFRVLPKVMDDALYSGGIVGSGGRQDVLEAMYADVAQNPRKDDAGCVRMSIISALTEDKSAAAKYVEEAYVRSLKEVLDRGYSYSDVCILVRSASVAQAIIERLGREMWNGVPIPVMSDDSLFVMSSDATLCIADVMRYLVSGERLPLFSALRVLTGVAEEALGAMFVRNDDMGRELEALRGLGVLELVGEVVNRMPKHLRDADSLYIDAFRQQVMEAMKDGVSDLGGIVQRIDDNRKKWVVAATSSRPAVKIMTIHKSKGLEFKVVLIPNCDWKLEANMGKETIWCSANPLEISSWENGVLPLTFNENLVNSDFHAACAEEREQVFADSLNVAYVAFTRPKEVLLAWGVKTATKSSKPKDGDRVSSGYMSTYLYDALAQMSGSPDNVSTSTVGVDDDGIPCEGAAHSLDVIEYVDGDIPAAPASEGSVPAVAQMDIEVPRSFDPAARFKINAEAESRIISDAEVGMDGSEAGSRALMISMGLTNHAILERVGSVDDLHKAVRRAVLDGLLSEPEAEAREIEMRAKIICDPVVSEWFDKGRVAKVWTETSMVGPAPDCSPNRFVRRRPDRVMRMTDGRTVLVDYKFGKRDKKHRAQVNEYVRWLKLAGFERVEAYLWYYSDGGVERVGL